MKRDKILEMVLEKVPMLSLLCYGGSISYGTQREGSDIDIKGFGFPPNDVMFGLRKWEQTEFKNEFDGDVYNIRKYFRLAMGGNPNILEVLFVQKKHVLYCDWVGDLIIENRHRFLSKRCYKSFGGYAESQLRKLQNKEYKESKRREDVLKYGYSTDNGYNLIRLLSMGIEILTEGDLTVLRPERQYLLSIRNGEVPYEKLLARGEHLKQMMDEAYVRTDLPNRCDFEYLNGLLVKIMEDIYGVTE